MILTQNEPVVVDKEVLILTSRDIPEAQQVTTLMDEFDQLTTHYGVEAKEEQTTAWAKRWELADVVIEGDDEAQQGIRFNLFQLFSHLLRRRRTVEHWTKRLHWRKIRRCDVLGYRSLRCAIISGIS